MCAANSRLLVVTDLDGTLLDEHYRWEAARDSVERLRQQGIPLVLNSSKTLAELVELADELETSAPVIAENGGIIAVPNDAPIVLEGDCQEHSGYRIYFLGKQRVELLNVAHSLRRERGFQFEGYADWSIEQIAGKTGLSPVQAQASSRRLATEPILWNDTAERWDEFISLIGRQNIRALKGGRFVHLMGRADKAGAMLELRRRYVGVVPEANWVLVALGDSPNDLAMLSSADIAVVIPDASGTRLSPQASRVVNASHPGPVGWHEAMTLILNEYS